MTGTATYNAQWPRALAWSLAMEWVNEYRFDMLALYLINTLSEYGGEVW